MNTVALGKVGDPLIVLCTPQFWRKVEQDEEEAATGERLGFLTARTAFLIPPAFRHTNVTSSSTAPPSLSSRTMGVERRGNARTSVDCDVQLITATAAWPARLTTISRVGALLRLEHGFPTGTPLHVAFGAPAVDGVLELRGQVVRTVASEDGVDVAVMFAPLNPLAFEMVDSLITSLRLQ
jgi:hypothetical protein